MFSHEPYTSVFGNRDVLCVAPPPGERIDPVRTGDAIHNYPKIHRRWTHSYPGDGVMLDVLWAPGIYLHHTHILRLVVMICRRHRSPNTIPVVASMAPRPTSQGSPWRPLLSVAPVPAAAQGEAPYLSVCLDGVCGTVSLLSLAYTIMTKILTVKGSQHSTTHQASKVDISRVTRRVR